MPDFGKAKDKLALWKAKRKAKKDQKAKYKADEITKAQYKADKKEIRGYTDY